MKKPRYTKETITYKDGILFYKQKSIGCEHGNGYLRTRFDGKVKFVHQIVWFLHFGYWPKMLDHINENKKDNRIENLRVVTNSQNMQNISISHKDKKSPGSRGISFHKKTKKYRVRFSRGQEKVYLGLFKTLEEAEFALEKERS